MAAHLTPSLGSDYVWGPTLGSANVGDEQRLWRIINVRVATTRWQLGCMFPIAGSSRTGRRGLGLGPRLVRRLPRLAQPAGRRRPHVPQQRLPLRPLAAGPRPLPVLLLPEQGGGSGREPPAPLQVRPSTSPLATTHKLLELMDVPLASTSSPKLWPVISDQLVVVEAV